MNIQDHIKPLRNYLSEAFKRVYKRKEKLGLIDGTDISKEIEDFNKKVSEFIQDHQDMCRIWNGEVCKENRRIEVEKYGEVRLLENNCIDGRICRAFKGEADILQTEEAVIALDVVQSDGTLIPRSPDVCFTLADITKEPLILGIAHFDLTDEQNGCAAISLTLNDFEGINEQAWHFLAQEEKDLVFEARQRSMEEANLVLIKLTSSRAVTNFTNEVRIEHGLKPLSRVSIVASYDTRTMGLVIKAPLFDFNVPISVIELAPFKRDHISTREFALEIKEMNHIGGQFKFGSFEETFYKSDFFEKFSTDVTKMTILLSEEDSVWRERIGKFINEHYGDLTAQQKKAFIFRFFRTVSHQYLTGLAEVKKSHPFSDHQEKYISSSQDARFFGKYHVNEQSFIVHIPDSVTGAKRIDIGASVMDKTGVDNGKPHALFIATSISKEVFENKNHEDFKRTYKAAINSNEALFRQIIDEHLIIKRVSTGNLIPIGVLLDSDTGEVLQIVSENYRYL